jgi:1-aminocyclopropane-1-carboxylate deaminase/D-cysteine desulfhydrase
MLEGGYWFSELVFASASGGTLAGFQVARAFLGFGPTPIAVLACDDVYADMHAAYVELAGRCASLLGVSELVDPADFRIASQFVGAGYGMPSTEGLKMIRRLRDSDGLMTEPIYTAKALAGFASLTSLGAIKGPSVFWHTGGLQGLMSPDISHAVLRYLSDHPPSPSPSR